MSDVSPSPADEASEEYSQEQVDLNLAELEEEDDLSSSMRGKTVRKKLTAAAGNNEDEEVVEDQEDSDININESVSPEKGKSALRDMLGGGVVPEKVEEEIKDDNESEFGEVIDSFDDDDGCDSEPILKFEPLVPDLAAVLGEDTASSLAVHGRVLVLGCGSGAVLVMDAWGNVMETRRHHAGSRVTGVSLDRDGEYFASCSEDGKVAVTGVSAENRDRVLQM